MRFQFSLAIFLAAAGLASSAVIPSVSGSVHSSSVETITPTLNPSHPDGNEITTTEPSEMIHLIRRGEFTLPTQDLGRLAHLGLSVDHNDSANHYKEQKERYEESIRTHTTIHNTAVNRFNRLNALGAHHKDHELHDSFNKADREEKEALEQLRTVKMSYADAARNQQVYLHLKSAHDAAADGKKEKAQEYVDVARQHRTAPPQHYLQEIGL